jgi:protein-tyrosine-phosphatase
MSSKSYNVLFLCTGNSARSIMAESILNHLGQNRFKASSAGSHPTGVVNPCALALLREKKYPAEGLRSKSWDEFAGATNTLFDFIFTVCDNAAGEVCPIWPGHPMTVHWGFPDPATHQGTDAEIAAQFADVFGHIHTRLSQFIALPFDSLDNAALKQRLDALAKSPLETP